MKKIFTILMVIAALLFTGINVDAQKKVSSNKASTSITVKKNAEGYADPTGHTYKAVQQGVTILMTFKNNNQVDITVKAQGETIPMPGSWEQSEDVIYMECPLVSGYFSISSNGKVLTDEDGDTMSIIK